MIIEYNLNLPVTGKENTLEILNCIKEECRWYNYCGTIDWSNTIGLSGYFTGAIIVGHYNLGAVNFQEDVLVIFCFIGGMWPGQLVLQLKLYHSGKHRLVLSSAAVRRQSIPPEHKMSH